MGRAGLVRRIVAALGVAVLLAALSAPPSTAVQAARRVGPERPLSAPVEAAAPESQGEPSIAFDGTNYLLVWRDHRQNEDRDTGDIWGARVTPEGRLLDPVGFVIADGLVLEDEPEVAFGAGTYLVVWHDPHDDNIDVRGARVSPSGAVLDPDGIDISVSPTAFSLSPTVAFGDGKFLVTWEQIDASTAGRDIVGASGTRGGRGRGRPPTARSTCRATAVPGASAI